MGDRVTEAATIEHPLTPTLAKTANVLAKGALLAAVVLHGAWRHGYLVHPRPLTSEGRPAAAATA